MKKVLMIVGSIRNTGFNKKLAMIIEENLRTKGIEVAYANIAELPFMNQDIEFPAPNEVSALRRQVEESDAIWFVTPEYNEMIPGVLKNALDWLSRPLEPGVFGAPSFILNKVVVLSGAGGKKAAAVGLDHLATLLEFMGMCPMETVVGFQIPTQAFMTGKFELSDDQNKKVAAQVNSLIELFQ